MIKIFRNFHEDLTKNKKIIKILSLFDTIFDN